MFDKVLIPHLRQYFQCKFCHCVEVYFSFIRQLSCQSVLFKKGVIQVTRDNKSVDLFSVYMDA